MKFTVIAKAIFILGILTTSVMITENQSVNAKGKYEKMNRLYDTNKLHQYYSGPSYELTMLVAKVKVIMTLTFCFLTNKIKSSKCFYWEKMKINTKKKHMV